MPADDAKDIKPAARCPICRRETTVAFRPFCSRRCADIDLARWLGGTYAISGSEDSDEDGNDLEDDSNAPLQSEPKPRRD